MLIWNDPLSSPDVSMEVSLATWYSDASVAGLRRRRTLEGASTTSHADIRWLPRLPVAEHSARRFWSRSTIARCFLFHSRRMTVLVIPKNVRRVIHIFERSSSLISTAAESSKHQNSSGTVFALQTDSPGGHRRHAVQAVGASALGWQAGNLGINGVLEVHNMDRYTAVTRNNQRLSSADFQYNAATVLTIPLSGATSVQIRR
jgi:hypothetical protein